VRWAFCPSYVFPRPTEVYTLNRHSVQKLFRVFAFVFEAPVWSVTVPERKTGLLRLQTGAVKEKTKKPNADCKKLQAARNCLPAVHEGCAQLSSCCSRGGFTSTNSFLSMSSLSSNMIDFIV
jgi:hypothetical protein